MQRLEQTTKKHRTPQQGRTYARPCTWRRRAAARRKKTSCSLSIHFWGMARKHFS